MSGILRSAFLAVTLGLAAALPAAAGPVKLKFASFFAPNHPYVASTFAPFVTAVEEGSGGTLSVTLYQGGELGAGPAEQYARAVDGVAELAVGLPGYTASSFPLTLLTELPGVIEEATGTAAIWRNIDRLAGEYRRVKLVALWSGAENLLYSAKRPIRRPEDMRGMKIRVPSRNAGLVVEAWGGTPVAMPVSDIYNALQTGVIDAAMIDGTATRTFRLAEVTNYLTHGMQTTISPFFIVMNREAFAALDPVQQAAVEAAGREASMNGQAVQIREARQGIADFAALPGKEVIHLEGAEAEAFNTLARPVVERITGEAGEEGRAFVAALRAP